MFGSIIDNVRRARPRVHCITNYVTANDCANILLACGASPIMADCPEERAELTALCNALVINLGTLSPTRLEAMLISGKKANELGIPAVLDPVGAGASGFRTGSAMKLLDEIRFSIIRGNLSEIKSLAGSSARKHGVDSADIMTEDMLRSTAALARELSERTGAVTVITGETDIAADADSAYLIRNGAPIMQKITGCGCMLSSVMGAFAAVSPGSMLNAAAEATAATDICGELAAKRLAPFEGNASCRNRLIDAFCSIAPAVLSERAVIEKIDI